MRRAGMGCSRCSTAGCTTDEGACTLPARKQATPHEETSLVVWTDPPGCATAHAKKPKPWACRTLTTG
jgi:hypothetical protein